VKRYGCIFEAEIVLAKGQEIAPPPRTLEEAKGWQHMQLDPVALLDRGRGGTIVRVQLERIVKAEGDVQAFIEFRSLVVAKLREMGFANPTLDIESREITVRHYEERRR
jgi:hypothetical protein